MAYNVYRTSDRIPYHKNQISLYFFEKRILDNIKILYYNRVRSICIIRIDRLFDETDETVLKTFISLIRKPAYSAT